MKRVVQSVFGWMLMLGVIMPGSAAWASDYQPGEVIVKYKDGVVRTRTFMSTLYDAAGAYKVQRFSGIMRGLELVTLQDDVKIQDAIAAFERNSAVEYAQPNYLLYALPVQDQARDYPQATPTDPPGGGFPIPCIPGFDIPGCDPNAKIPCLIPGVPFPPGCEDGGTPPPGNPGNPGNPGADPELQDRPADVNPPVADPDLAKAYGLEKVQAQEAWKKHKGDSEFIVAVIDTGIDYNHEDLAFNVWRNPNPTRNDVVGYDFVHDDGLPFDDNEHGTHVAGTVGAVGGNGKAIAGVTQRVSIMGLKFLSGQGSGTTADAIRAIDYAVEHGAKVLNNSWGGKGDTGNNALKEAIVRAEAKDVLFVAAAGNDGTNNDGSNASYPAAFDNENILAVAATDQSDQMAFFSNYGKVSTDVAAPGVNVYSTVPGNQYRSHSGTSMASPHVAGAAALIWSMKPELTHKQVKDILMDTVDKLPGLDGKMVTGGRINVLKALEAVESME